MFVETLLVALQNKISQIIFFFQAVLNIEKSHFTTVFTSYCTILAEKKTNLAFKVNCFCADFTDISRFLSKKIIMLTEPF